ncbi:hypothetical protein [Rathayibacter toxicus]|nr:hypothetical protein [Rathayibacter toxicus]
MNVYLAAVLPELAAFGWDITVLTRGESARSRERRKRAPRKK